MDVVTEKSNHNVVGVAVSVCLTPAAPSPLPIPYPLTGSSAEGVDDSPMRTKKCGVNGATVGANVKVCHGNEPGTLKEVVSLNTGGRCPPLTGAFTVLTELGPLAITGSMVNMNKGLMPGMSSNASDAGNANASNAAASAVPGASPPMKDPDSSSNKGGDSGGDADGASKADPNGPGYCPQAGQKAPPGMVDAINQADLYQHIDPSKATPAGRAAATAALDQAAGAPGGAKGGLAFWAGPGRDQAVKDGYAIQESAGGAQTLDQMYKGGQLPAGWNDEMGSGSGITQDRLWKTISMRTAAGANGDVQAYVTGEAQTDRVFGTIELPTMLNRQSQPPLTSITFRAPLHPAAGSAEPVVWTKKATPDCPQGKWTGPPVPAGSNPPHKYVNPGFTLHPDLGFVREPTS